MEPERCRSELTRTNSTSSFNSDSSISADYLKILYSRHFRSAESVEQAARSQWTNKKHSLYLDSLEASFVNDLHHSRCMLDQVSQENKCSKPIDSHNASRQDGCWRRMKSGRSEPFLESTADSPVTLESSRVHNSLSAEKRHAMAMPDLWEDCGEGRQETSLAHNKNSVSSNYEVCAQNFVVGKECGGMSTCTSVIKRSKKVVAGPSSNDQVVPFGNFHSTSFAAIDNESS